MRQTDGRRRDDGIFHVAGGRRPASAALVEAAHLLIRRARRLYTADSLAVDLDNTVYALDPTTIELCLSVFPWTHFRATKAAVKMHTLLDLRGNIPSFIHVSDGKLDDVNVLDLLVPEPGAVYVMDRGYIDCCCASLAL
jgi:hypothetical protein